MTSLPSQPARLPGFLLLGVSLTVLLRLLAGQLNLWYWDEGYMAEISLDLSRLARPRAGALWWDGFFPLTTSWLAPSSAAPLHWLPGLNALQAVRLWAALLTGVSALFLARLGEKLGGRALGLLALFLYACLPLCVKLGAWGLYHALGTALALYAFDRSLEGRARPRRQWFRPELLIAGIAWAACYWLWWVPLGLLLKAWAEDRKVPWASALLAALPLAALLGLQLALGGDQAASDFKSMLTAAGGRFEGGDLRSKLMDLVRFPLLSLGLCGLLLLPRLRAWLAPVALIHVLEIFRQRGGVGASAYLLLPVLPLLCLGLAQLCLGALAWRKALGGALALLAILAAQRNDLSQLTRFCMRPQAAHALGDFLKAQDALADTVVGLPPLNWSLRPFCKATEPAQLVAYRQWPGPLLGKELKPSAFAWDLSLEKLRYFIVTPDHHQRMFWLPSNAILPLKMEQEGWPQVFEGEGIQVFANPRWPGVRKKATPILRDRRLYELAAAQAAYVGLDDLKEFALERAQ